MNENDIEGEEDGVSGMDGEVKVKINLFSLRAFVGRWLIGDVAGYTIQYERRIGRGTLRCRWSFSVE